MTRPRHTSIEAYLRYMQMSKHAIFACVEGHRADRFLYGEICTRVCETSGVSHQIVTPEELPNGARGKPGLLAFFEQLRERDLLETNLNGKLTAVIFFADKDVDDFLQASTRHTHLIYTKHYDIESHIFRAGDLVTLVAALGGFGVREVANHLSPTAEWRARVALLWKEWVKLCLFCKKHSVRGHPGYGVVSQINRGTYGPVDPALQNAYKASVHAASAFTPEVFDRKFRAVSRLVEHLYRSGRHDAIFKGKWYKHFIVQAALQISNGRQFDRQAIESGIVGALSAASDLDDEEFRHFHTAVAIAAANVLLTA